MMFLNNEEIELLTEMSILRTGYHIHNGKQTKGKLFLLGENECTLTGASYRLDKNGKAFIECIFKRNPCFVDGLKTKIAFVPHSLFVFDYDQANELCKAFGTPLKPQPDTEQFNDYFRRVCKGVNTFVSKKVKVAVSYSKHRRTDEYGEGVMKQIYYDREDEVWDWRVNMLFNIDEKFDWWEVSRIFVE